MRIATRCLSDGLWSCLVRCVTLRVYPPITLGDGRVSALVVRGLLTVRANRVPVARG